MANHDFRIFRHVSIQIISPKRRRWDQEIPLAPTIVFVSIQIISPKRRRENNLQQLAQEFLEFPFK